MKFDCRLVPLCLLLTLVGGQSSVFTAAPRAAETCPTPSACTEGDCNYVINIPTSKSSCDDVKEIVKEMSKELTILKTEVTTMSSELRELRKFIHDFIHDIKPCLDKCNATSDCKHHKCLHGGTCIDEDYGAHCECPPPYIGPHCEHIKTTPGPTGTPTPDPCKYYKCEHGGTCYVEKYGPHCECPPPYIGPHCEHITTTTALPVTTTTDVDECKHQPSPCECGSTCVNTPGSYRCICRPGYTGPHCCTDIDECKDHPCHNGTCINTDGSYKCICPPDTTGKHCEHPIHCHEKDCGPHAKCFVGDHGKHCVCDLGYTGDPKKGCTLRQKYSCACGDPHYISFDRQKFDWQGTCPVVFTKTCNDSSTGRYPPFNVIMRDVKWSGRRHTRVSVVVGLDIKIYGLDISLNRRHVATVNGARVFLPWYWPSRADAKVTINNYGHSGLIFQTNFHLKAILWDNYRACVYVPDVPEYHGHMCGLAGDMDGDRKNDLRLKNGTIVTPKQASTFGDSWIWSDDQKCLHGKDQDPAPCTPEQHALARKQCNILQDPNGPFAPCLKLPGLLPNRYDDCVYDQCHYKNDENFLCHSLSSFAVQCQAQIPGIVLRWRRADFCPLKCPANQHYEPCASACPSTCSNYTSAEHCTLPCYEGCACDNGFVLNGQDQCIRVEDCGCKDAVGNYHPANSSWVNDDCTLAYQCFAGQITKQDIACTTNANCTVHDMRRDCFCWPGYEGDGRQKCTDIDECLVQSNCVHGTCQNTPGSYICHCEPNWTGEHCDKYVEYCKGVKCEHGGKCEDTGYAFKCHCKDGYFGTLCKKTPQRHCADLQAYHDIFLDGVYPIRLPDGSSIQVVCDMVTKGGGWTFINRRIDGREDFYRTWEEYAQGFGDKSHEFWLGNRYLAIMTAEQKMTLRVDLAYCDSERKIFESYDDFRVANESLDFSLSVGAFRGDAGNSLAFSDHLLNQNGMKFSTKDKDNDKFDGKSCAEIYHGGFWYNACAASNLNGKYLPCPGASKLEAAFWFTYHNDNLSAKHVEMKFRPTGYIPPPPRALNKTILKKD